MCEAVHNVLLSSAGRYLACSNAKTHDNIVWLAVVCYRKERMLV